MICRLIIGIILLHATLLTATKRDKLKPIKHVKGQRRTLTGSVDSPEFLDLEKGGNNYGNQGDNSKIDPTLTSVSAETGCHYKMDLALVLDCSHSIAKEGWARIKQASKRIANALDLSPQGTHVSIVVFSSDVEEFYVFNKYTYAAALVKGIDELKFYGSWSRLDIALNIVLSDVFNVKSGARTDVPQVVVVFTDGNTDGATNPDEVPNWPRILSKALNQLRHQNITTLAVASGSESNNYQELNLIGGDRNNVYNISDSRNLIDTLMQTSQWNCPEKPSVCVSMPSSCLTSSTCLPHLSTCIPVIPPTKCTPSTTACQTSSGQTDSAKTSSTQTPSALAATHTPTIGTAVTVKTSNWYTGSTSALTPSALSGSVQTVSIQAPSGTISSVQAPSKPSAQAVIIIKDKGPEKTVTITETRYVYLTGNQQKNSKSSTGKPTPSNSISSSSVTTTLAGVVTTTYTDTPQSTTQSIVTSSQSKTISQSPSNSISSSSVTTSLAGAVTTTYQSIVTSSQSKTISRSLTLLTVNTNTMSLSAATSLSQSNRSSMTSQTAEVSSNLTTPVTTATLTSSVNASSSVVPEPIIKPQLKNRLLGEKPKKKSWFDTIVPEFVRKWMAVEP